jgi:catechol 2,3-dioxygenase-like lactoylglutathione lyase family enzyme
MTQLNHTIVWCRDQRASADFLTEILGLPAARRFMHFLVVELSNGVSLDYYETDEPVAPQHYAFLVPDAEFDGILARVRSRASEIWADPARSRPGEINRFYGGRGFYFHDPDEHLLEVITRPYGDAAPTEG